MSDLLEYKGYLGSAETSIADGCLHGKILFISDLVTYQAETINDLKAEFTAAVDDYIETCEQIGKEAQRPFKGSFNVRISPELHKQAAINAQIENISMNDYISKAISCYVSRSDQRPINIEHHDHHHYHQEIKQIGTYGDLGESTWDIQKTKSLSH